MEIKIKRDKLLGYYYFEPEMTPGMLKQMDNEFKIAAIKLEMNLLQKEKSSLLADLAYCNRRMSMLEIILWGEL